MHADIHTCMYACGLACLHARSSAKGESPSRGPLEGCAEARDGLARPRVVCLRPSYNPCDHGQSTRTCQTTPSKPQVVTTCGSRGGLEASEGAA